VTELSRTVHMACARVNGKTKVPCHVQRAVGTAILRQCSSANMDTNNLCGSLWYFLMPPLCCSWCKSHDGAVPHVHCSTVKPQATSQLSRSNMQRGRQPRYHHSTCQLRPVYWRRLGYALQLLLYASIRRCARYVRSHSVLASSHVSLPPSISDCTRNSSSSSRTLRMNAAFQPC
jgi:hypothetical protein